MRKFLKFIIISIIILPAAAWLTSVAYGQTSADSALPDVRIEAAPLSAAPSATFYGNAIGSVTPGDLFYVDSVNSTPDISVNLYITNADQLIHYLRYLTLKVAVYCQNPEGQWERLLLTDGSAYPDTFLTLRNGLVTFNLPGAARYKVAVESGCFYCLSFRSNGEEIMPLFYLELDSA
ncbi:MAG: hypothetical protein A2Y90_01710 [Chloroflexi bacterium RBG_13_52_12]|nr:MAG: hypothetical protein A2Y90_01710 [Chloroflexi bacterium RBG_13_52_12]